VFRAMSAIVALRPGSVRHVRSALATRYLAGVLVTRK